MTNFKFTTALLLMASAICTTELSAKKHHSHSEGRHRSHTAKKLHSRNPVREEVVYDKTVGTPKPGNKTYTITGKSDSDVPPVIQRLFPNLKKGLKTTCTFTSPNFTDDANANENKALGILAVLVSGGTSVNESIEVKQYAAKKAPKKAPTKTAKKAKKKSGKKAVSKKDAKKAAKSSKKAAKKSRGKKTSKRK